MSTRYVPQFFQVSNRNVVQKAIDKGVLKYPGICFVLEDKSLIWITTEGIIEDVGTVDGITGVDYINGELRFLHGSTPLFSVDISMDDSTADYITETIIDRLNLSEFAKTTEIIQMLDNRIGDLGEHSNVVEYVLSLSYGSTPNIPIIQLQGSVTNPINLSNQSDGVYKITGQYLIGGTQQTIQSSSNSELFLIESGEDSISITKLGGNSIYVYNVFSDGNSVSTKYVTEEWINTQDFMSSAQVREYVDLTVRSLVTEVLDEILDEKIDRAIDEKIGAIESTDIQQMFGGI